MLKLKWAYDILRDIFALFGFLLTGAFIVIGSTTDGNFTINIGAFYFIACLVAWLKAEFIDWSKELDGKQ